MTLSLPLVAVRHLLRLQRAGQLRFRLETFGVYYPALPYEAPWWCVSPRYAAMLVKGLPTYMRWVMEMERLQSAGAVTPKRHGVRFWIKP
ncbi:MAG: hypothetical protein ACR2JC_03960 [Chloroflexota bacterium]